MLIGRRYLFKSPCASLRELQLEAVGCGSSRAAALHQTDGGAAAKISLIALQLHARLDSALTGSFGSRHSRNRSLSSQDCKCGS